MKLLINERKVREYNKIDSVIWTELHIQNRELLSLLPYLIWKGEENEPSGFVNESSPHTLNK